MANNTNTARSAELALISEEETKRRAKNDELRIASKKPIGFEKVKNRVYFIGDTWKIKDRIKVFGAKFCLESRRWYVSRRNPSKRSVYAIVEAENASRKVAEGCGAFTWRDGWHIAVDGDLMTAKAGDVVTVYKKNGKLKPMILGCEVTRSETVAIFEIVPDPTDRTRYLDSPALVEVDLSQNTSFSYCTLCVVM